DEIGRPMDCAEITVREQRRHSDFQSLGVMAEQNRAEEGIFENEPLQLGRGYVSYIAAGWSDGTKRKNGADLPPRLPELPTKAPHGIAADPASLLLDPLWQVPMMQAHPWFDADREHGIGESVIKRQPCFV